MIAASGFAHSKKARLIPPALPESFSSIPFSALAQSERRLICQHDPAEALVAVTKVLQMEPGKASSRYRRVLEFRDDFCEDFLAIPTDDMPVNWAVRLSVAQFAAERQMWEKSASRRNARTLTDQLSSW